jgi:hypothetical protein
MLADIGSKPGARRKSSFTCNADSVRKIIVIYPVAGLNPAIYE